MTIIEEIKWNAELKGELRGIEIGEQRVRAEAVKKEDAAIKRMLDNKIDVEMIAEWFQTTVEHVGEVQQRLKMR